MASSGGIQVNGDGLWRDVRRGLQQVARVGVVVDNESHTAPQNVAGGQSVGSQCDVRRREPHVMVEAAAEGGQAMFRRSGLRSGRGLLPGQLLWLGAHDERLHPSR